MFRQTSWRADKAARTKLVPADGDDGGDGDDESLSSFASKNRAITPTPPAYSEVPSPRSQVQGTTRVFRGYEE